MLSDLPIIFQWWGTLFLVGAAAYPLTKRLFPRWFDKGYFFSKAVGMATVTYLVYLLGVLHVAPFVPLTIWVATAAVFISGVFLNKGHKGDKGNKGIIILEEVFFFIALLFWCWIKAHEPSIHNLEKFMDFGFTKSILDSTYFPAPDMWYAGGTINYYYFGHTVMAVLTRLSGIDLTSTFNLMLATIFALCFTMSFAIGKQLTKKIGGGVLTAFLVTLAGNMQTIYAFTIGYDGDKVQPFWQLLGKMDFNRYWYADATRFIPFTIHEFPSYSFVVSDVHGHVLSIPFVLLAIGLLITLFSGLKKDSSTTLGMTRVIFYGFLCSVLLMTNALDGPIYLGLFLISLVLFTAFFKKLSWEKVAIIAGVVISVAAICSLPFMLYFKSFVTGIAVNCPPAALADTKIGPILFEGVEKCQHSPLWMMWLLWGFFIYCGGWLLYRVISKRSLDKARDDRRKEVLLSIFFIFSVLLIIFPEFFYFKDIYPTYFRSNTMFKLGYQAFIMFSIVSGYTIFKLFKNKIFLLFLIPQLFLVSIYPIFSVRSYFDSLRTYEGINGSGWIAAQYSDDWAGILWINDELRLGKLGKNPVIVEADGDSYTDYDRVSAFTGLPTIVGWSVHEWLWRGSYDVVAPRKMEVQKVYESTDSDETQQILAKYHVQYIFVGTLERQKFKNLQEWKFKELGKAVFTSGETTIYHLQ